jgi:plastocyanin
MSGLGRKAILAAIAVLALALLAPATASARQWKVLVGGFTGSPTAPIALTDFYPKGTEVHVGDTVLFTFGGVHTVTFPDGTDPGVLVPQLPTPYPASNDPGGTPWWWSSTPVGEYAANLPLAFPSGGNVVDGSQLVNSGLSEIIAPTKFYVTFPKVGTFKFYCSVHPLMRGTIRVRPKGVDLSKEAGGQAQRAQAQMGEDITKLNALAAKVADRKSTTKTVLVAPGNKSGFIFNFVPTQVTVKVGQPLAFTFDKGRNGDFHTVSFGPDTYLDALSAQFGPQPPQGIFTNPETVLPTEPPGAGRDPFVVSPTTHGNGFVSSGLVDPPAINGLVVSPPPAGSQTTFHFVFTQPGVYHFQCIVHAFMQGDVTVTP